MADFFEELADPKTDKGQTIKSNEITGERFPFHSLPKEFQDLHNVYYILEKQSSLDSNAISRAILNGHMWKAIGDGTAYGMIAIIATVGNIIKWKLSGFGIGLLFTVLFFIPMSFYIAYHSIFYAMIRAQIVGAVTRNLANVTANTYYVTFMAIFFAILVVFVFSALFARDFLMLMFWGIAQMNPVEGDLIGTNIQNALIWLHNIGVELFFNKGPFYDNIFFITFLNTFLFGSIVYLLDRKYYNKHKSETDSEVVKLKNSQGYPIETAQRLIKEWRKRNGM